MSIYYISHSAKGSTWKNHKYIKKVGHRYYYSDDLKRGQERIKAQQDRNNAIREAMGTWENSKGHISSNEAMSSRVAFNRDEPGSADNFQRNLEGLQNGSLNRYSSTNARDYNAIAKAVAAQKRLDDIDAEQKEADKNRSIGSKLKLSMLNTQEAAKVAINRGKRKVANLFKKKKKEKSGTWPWTKDKKWSWS